MSANELELAVVQVLVKIDDVKTVRNRRLFWLFGCIEFLKGGDPRLEVAETRARTLRAIQLYLWSP
jgi:hypothetical protein